MESKQLKFIDYQGNKQQPLPELHHSLLMSGKAEVAALAGKRCFSVHENILQDRISTLSGITDTGKLFIF
jgi:hypothetical protein